MILQIIDEDSLLALKLNLQFLKSNFLLEGNSWIEEYIGRPPFINSKFLVDDFRLDMSHEKPFFTEFENVKRVYSRLNFLSESQASDERLWAGLCLTDFWEYTQYRWGIKEKCTVDSIKQHFFFGFGSRRSLTRNAMARLWWIGRLTYDSQRSDPYELTRFVCENSDYIMHILERNTSNNPAIISTFLVAVLDARKEGCQINTNLIGELSKYLNLLGGTYILDCLPQEILYGKIIKKTRELGC